MTCCGPQPDDDDRERLIEAASSLCRIAVDQPHVKAVLHDFIAAVSERRYEAAREWLRVLPSWAQELIAWNGPLRGEHFATRSSP